MKKLKHIKVWWLAQSCPDEQEAVPDFVSWDHTPNPAPHACEAQWSLCLNQRFSVRPWSWFPPVPLTHAKKVVTSGRQRGRRKTRRKRSVSCGIFLFHSFGVQKLFFSSKNQLTGITFFLAGSQRSHTGKGRCDRGLGWSLVTEIRGEELLPGFTELSGWPFHSAS